ncbi:hypothetical protein H6P81_009998 [Aristolochia fimbriata]|uniref:DNL-type domain-containing protein n=1 Tax=Aristolochia fimbriata TaxID=158543 RepID=A0AAV7ERZ1_ARIFI|nr:hypothetical protein H6P81_009998 [Aristolochia fimbriata]
MMAAGAVCCAVTSPSWILARTTSFSTACFPSPCAYLRPRKFSGLKIARRVGWSTKRDYHFFANLGCEDNNSELPLESEPSSCLEESRISSSSNLEATVDLKFPRRSLLVQFTCNACGERSQRLINRLAYERGTVFVQCAGCLQHHKLVDNLSLVVEYDLMEDEGSDENMD